MRIFSHISFRLNAFVIGLLTLAAVTITALGGSLSSASFEAHIRTSTFPALMGTMVGLVDQELLTPVRSLDTLAENPFFIEWIKSGGSEEQASLVFGMGRQFMETYKTSGMNVVLRDSLRYFQLDAQNEKVFTTSKERDSWFFDFEASGTPLGVNIHGADDPLYPGMIFFNRRIERDGKFLGIISTGMKLETVLNKLDSMAIGERGVIMLARADGTLLTHTDKKLVGSSLKTLPGYEKEAASVLAKDAAEFEYVNADNERMLVRAQRIPVLNLVVVAEANLNDLLAGMTQALWFAIGLGFVLIAIGCVAGILLIRTVTRPLHEIMGIAQTLTRLTESNSDISSISLSQTHAGLMRRKDELGSLARTLDVMVGSLQESSALARSESAKAQEESARVREAMREVSVAKKAADERTNKLMDVARRLASVAEVVKTASASLEKHVETANDEARAQAAHLGATAASMGNMTSTVQEVAQNAAVASQSSNATRQRATSGAAVVGKAVASINRVQEQSAELKVDMAQLGERAQAIAHIMNVISDIADQTNLLALNAAIEAARAGEAGKGFAVVADEVRKLAEKTMISTVDVGKAIRDIQQSADNSLARMDTAMESVGEATALSAESGQALDEIVKLMDDTANQVQAIAGAAEAQSAASKQIDQSIADVTTSSQQTAQAMHDAAQAVTELAEQARTLTSLIEELNAG